MEQVRNPRLTVTKSVCIKIYQRLNLKQLTGNEVTKRGFFFKMFIISISLTEAAIKETSFGRFEQSFMFHIIRDFFLLLILVAGLELAICFPVVVYDFKSN